MASTTEELSSIPGTDRDFHLLQSLQINSAIHPASYSMGTGLFVRDTATGVELNTQLHIVPGL
jgi:hypothetical protein